MEAIASPCCFFEFLRHIFGAGTAEEPIAVSSQDCKSLFEVLRHRTHFAEMSFASKLSSDSMLPARQRGALSECEECVIDACMRMSSLVNLKGNFVVKACQKISNLLI